MARRVMMLLAIASLGVLALAFAGCGGSDKSAATTETTAATTTETTTEATTTETTTTDTTATETTDTTATETTDTSAIPDFATSENCKQFAEIGAEDLELALGFEHGHLDDVAEGVRPVRRSRASRHQGRLPDAGGLVRPSCRSSGKPQGGANAERCRSREAAVDRFDEGDTGIAEHQHLGAAELHARSA